MVGGLMIDNEMMELLEQTSTLSASVTHIFAHRLIPKATLNLPQQRGQQLKQGLVLF
jgi:hypothetical protein